MAERKEAIKKCKFHGNLIVVVPSIVNAQVGPMVAILVGLGDRKRATSD